MLSDALAYGGGEAIGAPSAALIYWFLMGLFQGLSSDTPDERRRVKPNQGIGLSLRNGIIIGLISGCVSLLIYISNIFMVNQLGHVLGQWVDSIIVDTSEPVMGGVIIGLAAALLVGLLMGGLACLRHGVLRWLLWRSKSIPWNYPRFLDYAAERILLRKVGGGYIFVHRLLLEYFAALAGVSTSEEDKVQKRRVLSDS